MADIIYLTDKPIRVAGTGKQELRLALDVSAYDELDLLWTLHEGPSTTSVKLITGMQIESENGWPDAETSFTFPSAAPASVKRNYKNFLARIRWEKLDGGTATFMVVGIGRRWA
jgi:hypothetical protein